MLTEIPISDQTRCYRISLMEESIGSGVRSTIGLVEGLTREGRGVAPWPIPLAQWRTSVRLWPLDDSTSSWSYSITLIASFSSPTTTA